MQPLIRTFDEHTPPAVRHLTEVADILSVTEPEIFRFAYRFYYDRDLPESLLDELFGGYLTRQELPGWVRTYCNRVLSQADVGELVPQEYGVETRNHSRTFDQQFASWLTLIGFLVYLFLLT